LLDKYGLKDIKFPDGTEGSIKAMLLERHPDLLTDPYMVMFLDNVANAMSEDTLRDLGSPAVGMTREEINSQIADVRSQMDAVMKENPSNFKGNAKYKDLRQKKTKLYEKLKKMSA
jgi:hypothetical protein